MLRFLIKYPYKSNLSNVSLYSNLFLQKFKKELLKNVNYNKIEILYNYLINNNYLQFEEGKTLDYKTIIQSLVNQFKVNNITTNNNQYSTCICLYDYILIPNSNMSFSHFLRFIQYGNDSISPYPWVNETWKKLNEQQEELHNK